MASDPCTTCLGGLATVVAGGILAAIAQEVFPRLQSCLENCFTDLIRILRGNTAPKPLEVLPTPNPSTGDPSAPTPSPGDPGLSREELPKPPEQPRDPAPNPEELPKGQMITARGLKIEHSGNIECWDWIKDSRETRFKEVAVSLGVWWFDIKTKTNFLSLSANTKYGAHLIFRITPDSEGLDTIMKASVSGCGMKDVCLKPTTAMSHNIGLPIERRDGWMELELGQFECDNVTDKEVGISIKETKHLDIKKVGLIVAGIEIRPII